MTCSSLGSATPKFQPFSQNDKPGDRRHYRLQTEVIRRILERGAIAALLALGSKEWQTLVKPPQTQLGSAQK
ncbi:MAG: hypothetical protein MJA27_35880 [Pseudanabaenales cyanobacterium]|nr:hypothetical protein [Pseudanabaenales cyanobacterium]